MSTLKAILPNGVEVVGSPDDVANLIRALTQAPLPVAVLQRRKPRHQEDEDEGAFDPRTATIAFLAVLTDHDLRPSQMQKAIMQAVKARHPKGVGARLAKINAYITSLGFDKDAVYTRQRAPDGARVYRAGAKLHAARDAAIKAGGA